MKIMRTVVHKTKAISVDRQKSNKSNCDLSRRQSEDKGTIIEQYMSSEIQSYAKLGVYVWAWVCACYWKTDWSTTWFIKTGHMLLSEEENKVRWSGGILIHTLFFSWNPYTTVTTTTKVNIYRTSFYKCIDCDNAYFAYRNKCVEI